MHFLDILCGSVQLGVQLRHQAFVVFLFQKSKYLFRVVDGLFRLIESIRLALDRGDLFRQLLRALEIGPNLLFFRFRFFLRQLPS